LPTTMRDVQPGPAADLPDTDAKTDDIGRFLITCPDRPGIVAAISRFLFDYGANITQSQQYSTDPFDGTFFLRVEFCLRDLAACADDLSEAFRAVADQFSMRWQLARADRPKRVAILVSRADHALQELLWRHRSGELPAKITMIISNHPDAGLAAQWSGIPFYHVPTPPGGRAKAEHELLELLAGRTDVVVLARYMQILSPEFLAAFTEPIINIHHSFLPAFSGANPYQQAADRGVKLIGATAHYVTPELDAGPVIEQDIVRVDHRCSVADLRRLGRHVERAVLARAVGWHLEDRVIVHENKTIVFA
jgi:formyltetrahydrofolate deformylase